MDSSTNSSAAKPLMCPAPGCQRSFRYPSDLENHWKIHVTEKNFMCESCGEAFGTDKTLQKHKFVVHNIGDPVYCDKCFKPFHSEEAVRAHCKVTHEKEGKKYNCRLCNEEFFANDALREHMKSHKVETEETDDEFVSPDSGFSHSQWHVPAEPQPHRQVSVPPAQDSFIRMLTDATPTPQNFASPSVSQNFATPSTSRNFHNPSTSQSFATPLTSQSFPTPSTSHHPMLQVPTPQEFQGVFENALMDIQQQHQTMIQAQSQFQHFQPLQANPEEKEIEEIDLPPGEKMPLGLMVGKNVKGRRGPQPRLNLPFSVAGDGQFVCSICNKGFKHRSGLTRHHHMHQGYKRYQCEECDRGFPDRWHLNEHIKVKHSNVKEFCCTMCDEGFHKKAQLEKHVNMVHLHLKFECPTCHRNYASQPKLDKHVMKRNCKAPKRKRLPATPVQMALDKPHLCKWCGTNFRTYEEAEEHIRTNHSDIRKKYERKPKNGSSGSGSRYICPICNKSYAHYSNLWIHKASMHRFSKKPFGCGYCGATFNRSDRLQKHVYSRHVVEIERVVQFLETHKDTGVGRAAYRPPMIDFNVEDFNAPVGAQAIEKRPAPEIAVRSPPERLEQVTLVKQGDVVQVKL